MSAKSNIVKNILKRLYQRSTPQLQVASKIASKVSPKSKIAAAIAAVATPALLAPGRKTKARKKGAGKPIAPRIKGTSARRGTYTARKRTGEGDQGTYSNIRPTMGTPGQDMSAIARRPNRVRRMKGGGIAIKGQGKAFLKSKR